MREEIGGFEDDAARGAIKGINDEKADDVIDDSDND